MAITPLSQAIYKGLDPGVYQPLQQLETGDALTQAGMDASPTTKWGALGRLAQSLSGAYLTNTSRSRLADTIAGGKKQAMDDLMAALQRPSAVPGAVPQSAPPTAAAQAPAVQSATAPSASDDASAAPAAAAQPDFGSAIAKIESGGKYDLLGPVTKTGDRAYGKYQVMGANIPEWTRTHLGREMSPQEFLASPEAQDAVFKGQFGQYAQKYGPEGAAKAWFAGEKGMKNPNAKDQLGTTVQGYADRFMSNLGDQSGPQAIEAAAARKPVQVAQAAPQPGSEPQVDVQRLLAITQNPYADDVAKQIAGKMLLQHFSPPQTDDIKEYEYALRQDPTLSFEKFMQRKKSVSGEYGLQAIWGVDKDGKPALIQLGKSGEAIQSKLPEGFQPAKDPIKVDAGTHFVLLDPQTRQPITTVPKDIAGKEAAEERGKAQGQAQVALPGAIADAEQTKSKIDELLKSEGLDSIVGPIDQFRPNWTLGDKGRDALARYDQLKGSAFLQAYGLLRGGGAITDIEGKKAEQAMARLDRAQSEPEFRTALKDFRDAIDTGLAKLKQRAGGETGAPSAAPSSASAASTGSEKPTAASVEKTIGGKTYVKIGDQWFEK